MKLQFLVYVFGYIYHLGFSNDVFAKTTNKLMEVIRKQLKRSWAFSNMVAFVRFHLSSYVHLTNFPNNSEKELKDGLRKSSQMKLFPV